MTTYRWFAPETDPLMIGVDPALMSIADNARQNSGVPFILTCGVRTPEHNAEVGGVADSAHISGNAIDLAVFDSTHLYKMVNGLLQASAQRLVIGIRIEGGKVVYHNLHVDNDTTKPSPLIAVRLYGVPEK